MLRMVLRTTKMQGNAHDENRCVSRMYQLRSTKHEEQQSGSAIEGSGTDEKELTHHSSAEFPFRLAFSIRSRPIHPLRLDKQLADDISYFRLGDRVRTRDDDAGRDGVDVRIHPLRRRERFIKMQARCEGRRCLQRQFDQSRDASGRSTSWLMLRWSSAIHAGMRGNGGEVAGRH